MTWRCGFGIDFVEIRTTWIHEFLNGIFITERYDNFASLVEVVVFL